MSEYGWIVTLLSFTVDFLLFLGSNRLCGEPPDGLRAAAASAVGALQVALCMATSFRFLSNWCWRCVFWALMGVIAFGIQKSAIQRGIVFVLLQIALLGITMGDGFWTSVLAALVIFLLCMAGNNVQRKKYVSVRIMYDGKQADMLALVDTGNTLTDPVTGLSVLVADRAAAETLVGLQEGQLEHPLQTLLEGKVPRLRLIPYTAIGQQKGMLLGIRPDRVYMDGRECAMVIAFAPQQIGQGKQYHALVGGMV